MFKCEVCGRVINSDEFHYKVNNMPVCEDCGRTLTLQEIALSANIEGLECYPVVIQADYTLEV